MAENLDQERRPANPGPGRPAEDLSAERRPQNPQNNSDIRYLQQFLQNAGFSPGPIDGVMGPQTQAALRAYQQRRGLPATGAYDQITKNDIDAVVRYVAGQETPAASGAAAGGTAAAPPAPAGVPTDQAVATAAPANANEIEKEIRERYPQFVAYLDHPELGPILRYAAAAGMGSEELAGVIYETEWWKTNPSTARAWDNLRAIDPATAQQRVLSRVEEIIHMSSRLGYTLDANVNLRLADQAIRFGWDENQLRSSIIAEIRTQPTPQNGRMPAGELSNSADALLAQSREYLVPLTRRAAEKWALDIADGTQSAESFRSYVAGLARGRFPWLSTELDQGNTPGRYFASHQQRIADILELAPEEVNFMDSQWSAVTDFTDSQGKRRSMSLSEVDNWARRNGRYKYTDAANEKGHNILWRLLNDMGEVA